jgi:hypothetical protein
LRPAERKQPETDERCGRPGPDSRSPTGGAADRYRVELIDLAQVSPQASNVELDAIAIPCDRARFRPAVSSCPPCFAGLRTVV